MTVLVGCVATGPKFMAGDLPDVRSEEILLVVYRPKTVIGGGNFDVPFLNLDDRVLARMRIGGHVIIPTTAGRHTLRTTESLFGQNTDRTRGSTEFDARGGGTAYFRYTESFASITPILIGNVVFVSYAGNYVFELVPEAVAMEELLDTHRMDIQ